MKHLPLAKGLFALVDDEDFGRCAQFRWYVGRMGYGMRGARKIDGSITTQSLSRFIMNAPDGTHVDHIDGNRLDNRKVNLRFCTNQQNGCNRGKNKNNKSGFKGVSWNENASKWMATIRFNYKQIHLGYFTDVLDAASAYASAAKKYHGEFART